MLNIVPMLGLHDTPRTPPYVFVIKSFSDCGEVPCMLRSVGVLPNAYFFCFGIFS